MYSDPKKIMFERQAALRQIQQTPLWDLIVIGGGATGLGTAVDAANRGLKTLLLEGHDFAKGTSSRSTKLVHGGVRYLAQGNIGLVTEALRERDFLLSNAAHLVHKQSFIIPCYHRIELLKYWTGLKKYDWLSVHHSFGASQWLSAAEVASRLLGIATHGLSGGVLYYDGQFDDARLALSLAQTAAHQGATMLNYCMVESLLKEGSRVVGVQARDKETNACYELKAKVVVNATGVFVDAVLQMDQPDSMPLVRPSQGIHLVLDRSFLPANAALMIPQTTDGRVLFALPWHGKLLVGTTDTALHQHAIEPCALDAEIDFVLQNLRQYLTRPPSRSDVLSVFAGLRPLAVPQREGSATKEISRSHKLMVAPSGLISITGGKWTTYRQMAEEVVNEVEKTSGFKPVRCTTRDLQVHGCLQGVQESHWSVYGADAPLVQELTKEDESFAEPLIEPHPYTKGQVVWAVRHEMARTVEDVLARRLRLLFLDAKAAMAAAPEVARLMAAELGKDDPWIRNQMAAFHHMAQQYLPADATGAEALYQKSCSNSMMM